MIIALKSIVNYETMGSRRKKFKGLVLSKFVSNATTNNKVYKGLKYVFIEFAKSNL
jgi:hypothetical protein